MYCVHVFGYIGCLYTSLKMYCVHVFGYIGCLYTSLKMYCVHVFQYLGCLYTSLKMYCVHVFQYLVAFTHHFKCIVYMNLDTYSKCKNIFKYVVITL